MKEIRETCIFRDWVLSLRDARIKAAVNARIRRLSIGNTGDCKSVGEGVFELRIHIGAGYRIYFCNKGTEIIILLVGGDKSTQHKDIKTAIELSKGMLV